MNVTDRQTDHGTANAAMRPNNNNNNNNHHHHHHHLAIVIFFIIIIKRAGSRAPTTLDDGDPEQLFGTLVFCQCEE